MNYINAMERNLESEYKAELKVNEYQLKEV